MNYSNFLGKVATRVRKRLVLWVATMLSRSVRLDRQDASALIRPLLDVDPRLTVDIIKSHARVSNELSVEALRALLGAPTPEESPSKQIDAVINFSAYERNAWVASKAAAISQKAAVLDAGAGECQYRSLFAHTEYRAQDFVQYGGTEQGPQRESWDYGRIDYVCDITSIPVADGSFDVVLCTEVLEHVPDPISAVRELARVLKPGGRFLLSAPLGSGLHQEPYHFYGGFSPSFYHKYLETVLGLEIVELLPIGGLMSHVAQEVHRAARVLDERGAEIDPPLRELLTDWLPRYLGDQDQKYLVEQFTVGYLVEARKPLPDATCLDGRGGVK